LGVIKSSGDISLDRLENTEYHFYGITTRLGNLDNAIFPTRKEIIDMRPVTTLEGRFKRLEEKLGVNMAFTDLDHRLKHIEDAWSCTKLAKETQYVPKYKVGDVIEFNCHGERVSRVIIEVGRHTIPYYQLHDYSIYECYQMDKGTGTVLVSKAPPKKEYVPKFPIGYKYGHEQGTDNIKEITGFGIGNDGVSPTYKSKFINRDGKYWEEDAQSADERYSKLFELIKPHLVKLAEKEPPKKTYKYQVGDTFRRKCQR
jgi:hypothetical protein